MNKLSDCMTRFPHKNPRNQKTECDEDLESQKDNLLFNTFVLSEVLFP